MRLLTAHGSMVLLSQRSNRRPKFSGSRLKREGKVRHSDLENVKHYRLRNLAARPFFGLVSCDYRMILHYTAILLFPTHKRHLITRRSPKAEILPLHEISDALFRKQGEHGSNLVHISLEPRGIPIQEVERYSCSLSPPYTSADKTTIIITRHVMMPKRSSSFISVLETFSICSALPPSQSLYPHIVH